MILRGWALMRHCLEGVSLEVSGCLSVCLRQGCIGGGGATGRCGRAARGWGAVAVRLRCGGHVENAW